MKLERGGKECNATQSKSPSFLSSSSVTVGSLSLISFGRSGSRSTAGGARRAASSGEPPLNASGVEAVTADRHDAHGVPVDELG
ncbi:hypothetical protein PR202_ga06202 [Eleusine coracana subsp. coracana]|uniref:Uncharacterized protein n=1 Tax=Eleusine coracana subsp. coracana TaxID=191504 RepID=A0AAV5BUF5_ELECO|nr:hypothetical protein PR202_ga06202 [Eleusine coracana subsp. coracana]